MPNNDNTTTSLGINVSQFKRGLQDATRQIKLANAEFGKAAAGMDKWSDSATGVQAKIKQLETVLDAENKKLEIQKQQLAEVEKTQGKNSAAADEMRIAISKQEAAIAKTEKSLGYFNSKLSDMGDAEKQAKSAAGQLTTTINDQQGKLDALKKKYTDVILAQGANSKEAKQLAAEITALSGNLQTNKLKMSEAESAADKLDKSLTEVGDAAEEAGKDAENAGNGGFTVLKGVMANLATQAINAAFNGLKSMAAALVDLGKQAISGYSEMEQLTGGVMKLFGTGGQGLYEYAESVGKSVDEVEEEYNRLMAGQSKLFENANNAYKTAGMSANEYMKSVTGFSAALINSLGGDTEEAARIADIAMRDLADNANTFGVYTTEELANVYGALARGSFQTLDSLNLGFAGTQQGMIDLINASGIFEEKIDSLDNVSFAQMLEAIHAVQEDMGIAGATAKEAAGTIEGSANAMKASWENLISAMALDDVDLEELIGQFTDSLLTYLGNVVPLVEIVIGNIQTLITEFAKNGLPQIAEMIGNVLPGVIGSITTLITSLVEQLLPQLLEVITNELPTFLNAGAQLLVTLITGIVSAIPDLTAALLDAMGLIIETITGAIPDVVDAFITAFPLFIDAILNAVPDLLDASMNLLMAIVDAIPKFIPYLTKELPKIITKIIQVLNKAMPMILKAAVTMLNAILKAVPVIVKALVPLLPQIVNTIVQVLTQNLPVILDAAIQMLMAIVNAIPVILDALVPQIPMIVNQIVTLLVNNIPVLLDAAIKFLMAIIDAIPQIVEALVPQIPTIVQTIVDVLTKNIPVLLDAAFQMFMAIVDAIPDFIGELVTGLGSILTTITESLIEPAKKFFSELWDNIKEIFSGVGAWFKEKFSGAWSNIKEVFSGVGTWFGNRWSDIKNVFSNVGGWFKEKFEGAWKKVKEVFEPVGEFFGGIWGTIKEKFTDIGEKVGKATSDAFKTAINWVLSKAIGIINGFISAINGVISVINAIPGVDIGKLEKLDVPQLAQGGVLKRGQIGLLEGNGAEAVVPLDQNKKWINATAREMKNALAAQGMLGKGGETVNNYNFTQNNTSPKPLNRLEIYRQTKNQFNMLAGVN